MDPADLPPELGWEGPLWQLYEKRLSTQWRVGYSGRYGLDYTPAIALIQARGWELDRSLGLLRSIEGTVLEEDAKRHDRSAE